MGMKAGGGCREDMDPRVQDPRFSHLSASQRSVRHGGFIRPFLRLPKSWD